MAASLSKVLMQTSTSSLFTVKLSVSTMSGRALQMNASRPMAPSLNRRFSYVTHAAQEAEHAQPEKQKAETQLEQHEPARKSAKRPAQVARRIPGGFLSPSLSMGQFWPSVSTPRRLRDSLMRDFEREFDALTSAFEDIPATLGLTGREGDAEAAVPFQTMLRGLAVDVKESEKEFAFHADVPGLTKSDIKVSMSPNKVLRVTGERKTEAADDREGFHRVERVFGTFERRFQLPQNVDPQGIKATVDHGVLEIIVPKTEPKPEPGMIDVKVE